MGFAATATTARTRVHAALVSCGITSAKIALGNAKVSTAPAATDTWARVTVRESNSTIYALGTPRTFEDVAVCATELFCPLGKGESPLRTLADSLRTLLPGGHGVRGAVRDSEARRCRRRRVLVSRDSRH